MINIFDKKFSDWTLQAKAVEPSVCDWIGIYFKESFVTQKPSQDLILGPYFGEATEHTRIPISKGLCGRAVRDEKIINVDDVREDSEHIACSLKTRSELVIPLRNKSGEIVAELDIDCNQLKAFAPAIEQKFSKFCESFAEIL
jgi:GAF domain-containing protein